MRFIKQFETISVDLKRGDLVIMTSQYSNYDYDLYILLEDVPWSKKKLYVFHIAEISFNKYSTWYEVVNCENEKVYKNFLLRKLHDNEENLLFNNIYMSGGINNVIVKRTNELTGINIIDTDDYKKFLITKKSEKYNL
jgi:hypothetical protein